MHARGQLCEHETSFWEQVALSLRPFGYCLILISHHRPSRESAFISFVVPNGLENASKFSISPFNILSSIPWLLQYYSYLLKMESQWRGSVPFPQIAARLLGILFFNNLYKAICSCYDIKFAAIWNGWHPQEIILKSFLESKKIPVYYIERAPIPGMIHLDRQGVLGGSSLLNIHNHLWINTNIDLGKKLLSSLNQSSSATWWTQPALDSTVFSSVKERASKKNMVILFTEQVSQDIQNIAFNPYFAGSLEAFEYLLRLLSSYKDQVFILGKHHPKSPSPPAQYEAILKYHGFDGAWSTTIPINQCLGVCTHVASVNSTTLYEALNLGIPALSMGVSLLSGKHIAYELNRSDSDTKTIKDWLHSDESKVKYNRWLHYLSYLLSHHFYAFTSPAATLPVALKGPGDLAFDIITIIRTGKSNDLRPVKPPSSHSSAIKIRSSLASQRESMHFSVKLLYKLYRIYCRIAVVYRR